MIRARIASLSVDSISNQPVVILKPLEEEGGVADDRLVPIWIGQAEATAILLALQGAEPPRPMTHDLLRNVIEDLGFVVLRVEITRLEEGTFYAALVLRGEEREVVMDARPSDCIALAVRVNCPLFIAEQVLEEAGVIPEFAEEETSEEEELERFRDFLENVDPSDFMSS
ncbi:MAG: bifunctional nuclease family protein [Coriobacteriia bacterium]|nr:bifunctional nuclease family protein [Coriobacteriia bacterium]